MAYGMDLCSTGHGEVCYADNSCPACEAMELLNSEIEALQERILKLEDEIIETQ